MMNRTTTILLFLTMAAAQTVVAQNSGAKPANGKPLPAARTTPVPTTVKVVPLAVPKPGAGKPMAVQVRPASGKTTVAVSQPKTVPVVAAKPSAPAHAVVAVSGGAPAKPKAGPFAAKGAGAPKPVQAQAKNVKNDKKAPTAAPVAAAAVSVQDSKASTEDKKQVAKTIGAEGRRDPFISPVVSFTENGSGCSTGKRCLTIDQIALKGIVKSEAGMIAVVVNSLDKAYFLRENDPVFNGYVVKITGDSIVFKETFHDKLGKPLTRDITKSISRPAA